MTQAIAAQREKIIAAMSIELERSPAFVGTFTDSGVLATRLYDTFMKALALGEYTARFVAYMVKERGETFDSGYSIAGYAHEAAPNYMTNHPDLTPEEAAEADIDCWEDGADDPDDS